MGFLIAGEGSAGLAYPGQFIPGPHWKQARTDPAELRILGITEEGRKTEAALNVLERSTPSTTPPGSSTPQKSMVPATRFGTFLNFPEILSSMEGMSPPTKFQQEITDPAIQNRGKPETVFAMVGAAASGMTGISSDAPHQALETLSGCQSKLSGSN